MFAGTKENHERSQSGQSTSRPRCELATFQIQVRSTDHLNHLANCRPLRWPKVSGWFA